MDTLQYLACRSYLSGCKKGWRIPHDIPGTTRLWVYAWIELIDFEKDEEVMDFIVECLTNGFSTRSRVPYSFRKRVEILSDTIGINRGPHERKNLSDVVIKLDPGFIWKKRKVTSRMKSTWDEFRIISSDTDSEMEF